MAHRLVVRPRDGNVPVISSLGIDANLDTVISKIHVKCIRNKNGSNIAIDKDMNIVPGQTSSTIVEGDVIVTYNAMTGEINVTETERDVKDVVCDIHIREGDYSV